ncbi:MAG: beta-ketoacyl-ACP reductase [Saprospiraceae bacterium]|nr:MAG: beta-ketoacyl-ACP reductase [Saprospiraceae bacterium]
MNTDFEGKNVLVTGGSRGIGAAVATQLAQRGARVCITFHADKEAARRVVAALPGNGHFAARADLSKPAAVEKLMGKVLEEFGRLHVVVNNAGIFKKHPIASLNYEEWQLIWNDTIGLNLLGAANVCYFAARHMMEHGGGRIVNISSRGAYRGEPEHTAYGASKAGLNALTQSLAQELAPWHIVVTGVAPGFVETDMTRALLEGHAGDAIRAQSPMNRAATPEEIAEVVAFLASDACPYITGAIVDVNGASYLR